MKTTKEKITHYTTEDEQVEAMVNGQSDAIFETRRRKAIRRITVWLTPSPPRLSRAAVWWSH